METGAGQGQGWGKGGIAGEDPGARFRRDALRGRTMWKGLSALDVL